MENKLKQFILALVFLYFLKLMVFVPGLSDALVFGSLLATGCFLFFKESSKEIKEMEEKLKKQDEKLVVFEERLEKANTKLAGLGMGQSIRK
jgi:phosphatidylglycerophosphatase A